MTSTLQISLFPSVKDNISPSWFAEAIASLGVSEISGWPDSFGSALHRWNAANSMRNVTVISLFSGAGGLDIGFHDVGFNIVECNEIEPAFVATIQQNALKGKRLEGINIVCEDIHQYQPSIKHVDFIIGGPPCQTFSAAGARAAGVNGTDDDRGNLFLQYARIINQTQPKGFLFENVYRIVGAQSGKPWKQIQSTFKDLGYNLYWRILDAADYGVPQFRERLIIVGLKQGTYRFPFPSHGPDSADGHNYYTAHQAVSGLEPVKCKIGIGGRHGYLLNDIPPGLNYSFYTERMGHPKPIFGWRSKFSDYLYKADPDSPVRTIKAQGGQYTGPFSWENRPFTIKELKRLQTFPDDYIIEGNRQRVIQQLGNSVPPQLARILALSIFDQVFGIRLPFAIQYMPDNYMLGFRKRKGKLTSVYSQKAARAIANISQPAIKHGDLIKGCEYFCLDSDLKIQTCSQEETSEFKAEYYFDKDSLHIRLLGGVSSSDVDYYSINITPKSHSYKKGVYSSLTTTLVSQSIEHKSLLALWKVYELLIQRYLYKDDLVQLFGYYQYKMAYTIDMTIDERKLLKSPFWRTVKSVTNGIGVGKIMPISELSNLYRLSDNTLVNTLTQMKNLGFEIRSHRTNQQIPEYNVLIPYSFPTLNERSLQRLKRL